MQVKITDTIQYIGTDDTSLDLFESQFVIPEGVSYNSYVIMDEKIAVMDTVDKRGTSVWERQLLQTLNGRKPDYLVIQHMEPDHSGSIARFLSLFPETVLVGNARTFFILSNFLDTAITNPKLTVKEGDRLALGAHTLHFYMAPMVHWPEVMVSYESREKVLFSADGFGKFGALVLTQEKEWAEEARRYYFNIVGKYGAWVQDLLQKVQGLEIAAICPLHGPILCENLAYYLHLYDMWSRYEPEKLGVLIAYASIHGNTAAAAKELAKILQEKGVNDIKIRDLARADMAEVIADAFYYDRMVLMAATYDTGIFPCMHDFLYHLQCKDYQKRKIAIVENGSWKPLAGNLMRKMLETMKEIEILEPMVTIRSALKERERKELEQLAAAVAAKK